MPSRPPRLCLVQLKHLPCPRYHRHLSTSSSHHRSSSSPNTHRTTAPPPTSKDPIDDYYAMLLEQPLPVSATTSRPVAQPPSSSAPTATASSLPLSPAGEAETEKEKRARIIFGSKLSGAAAHHAVQMAREEQKLRGEGDWVGGTWIPPRPEEPDNCCMSGCVNCVWDGYRDELEGWALVRAGAFEEDRRRRMARAEEVSGSMDDDGGGSEALWDSARSDDPEELFQGVPVGIREFMKSEKRLREQKKRREEQIQS